MFNTINGWTKTTMIAHILKNFKGKSISDDGDLCLYRGPNGRKCAVGLFIPDDLYQDAMDYDLGDTYNDIVKIEPKISSHMPLEKKAMTSLQTIHDTAHKTSKVDKSLDNMLDWINKNVA